jgi:hypothetical protein
MGRETSRLFFRTPACSDPPFPSPPLKRQFLRRIAFFHVKYTEAGAEERKDSPGTDACWLSLSSFATVFSLGSRGKWWYSNNLCADARPFAPNMSCGSRATQVNPEALVILFRETPETAFLCG